MATPESMEATRKFRIALDLHRAGVSMMRARLHRLHPEDDDEAIQRRLDTWLRTRPGAEWGDTVGRRRDVS